MLKKEKLNFDYNMKWYNEFANSSFNSSIEVTTHLKYL